MDDLNFNVDDIINDVNAKIKSAEKNEADEESVEAEPIADTENSSEACEQADNTDEKPQKRPMTSLNLSWLFTRTSQRKTKARKTRIKSQRSPKSKKKSQKAARRKRKKERKAR